MYKNAEIQSGSESPLRYEDDTKRYNKDVENLVRLWNDDTEWKLEARKILGICVPLVLLAEIIFVVLLIKTSLFCETFRVPVKDYQILISTFSVGVIVQTAYIFKVMVRWLFSDINYGNHPIMNKNGQK